MAADWKLAADTSEAKGTSGAKSESGDDGKCKGIPARVLKPAAAASSRQDFQPPGTYAWTPTPEALGPQLAHLLEEPTAADELMREGMELAAEEEKLSKEVEKRGEPRFRRWNEWQYSSQPILQEK